MADQSLEPGRPIHVLTDCSQTPQDGAGLLTSTGTDGPRSEYTAGPGWTPPDRLDRQAVAGGQGVAGSNPASCQRTNPASHPPVRIRGNRVVTVEDPRRDGVGTSLEEAETGGFLEDCHTRRWPG